MTKTARARVARPDPLRRLMDWFLGELRCGYGLAVMRIGYGSISLILMLMYLPHYSYSFGRAAAWSTPFVESSAVNSYIWPITEIFPRGETDASFLVKFALLGIITILFILGWRMRFIAPAFVVMWLAFSTINPLITNTGHYQTFRVMLLFMLFADLSRRWSLDARRRERHARAGTTDWMPRILPSWLTVLLNNSAVIAIGFQLCMIYVVSALWKLQGPTWHSGVAVYYPLRLEELTMFPALNDLVWSITPLVFLGSWASVYLQLFFPVLLLNRWTRIFILIAITGMHIGIGILLALPFFSAAMIFADAIFIRESSWRAAIAWIKKRFARPEKIPSRVEDTAIAGVI